MLAETLMVSRRRCSFGCVFVGVGTVVGVG